MIPELLSNIRLQPITTYMGEISHRKPPRGSVTPCYSLGIMAKCNILTSQIPLQRRLRQEVFFYMIFNLRRLPKPFGKELEV